MDNVQYPLASWNLPLLHSRLTLFTPQQIILWAYERFAGRVVASTSFGQNSAILLHLLAVLNLDIPVIRIDPGDSTLEDEAYGITLMREIGIKIRVYQPRFPVTAEEQALKAQGEEGLRRFYEQRKLEPMERALAEHGALAILHGVRADQNEHRATLRHVELRPDGRARVYPILRMDTGSTIRYLVEEHLPVHPRGLPGRRENECGLHIQ